MSADAWHVVDRFRCWYSVPLANWLVKFKKSSRPLLDRWDYILMSFMEVCLTSLRYVFFNADNGNAIINDNGIRLTYLLVSGKVSISSSRM